MKWTKNAIIVISLFLGIIGFPDSARADNCSGLSDCFNGNLHPAIWLLLGLLLLLLLIWGISALGGFGALLTGLRALASRGAISAIASRVGRFLARTVGRGPRLSRSAGKSVRSLQKRLAEHQRKLKEYLKNPDKYDNKGFLKNAPSKEVRDKIINQRKKHLENEIKNFQKQIDQLKGGK